MKLRDRDGNILYESNAHLSTKKHLQIAHKQNGHLNGVVLSHMKLNGIVMDGFSLRKAMISYTSLAYSSLIGADLTDATIGYTNLSAAIINRAKLVRTSINNVDFDTALFYRTHLTLHGYDNVNLIRALTDNIHIEFMQFPVLPVLQNIYLGRLSDELTIELMCRDAWGSPAPEHFISWANDDPRRHDEPSCPVARANTSRIWHFKENSNLLRDHLSKGYTLRPRMEDVDLIREICKYKGWIIH